LRRRGGLPSGIRGLLAVPLRFPAQDIRARSEPAGPDHRRAERVPAPDARPLSGGVGGLTEAAFVTTDYDPIAEQYKRAKLQPWRTHVESYTLIGLLGDLSGKSVVDVACGDGYYTRLLRAHGARSVRGIDLSERMIALARAQEQARPLGIEYEVGDGRDLKLATQPDIVAAAYLLNYARDR